MERRGEHNTGGGGGGEGENTMGVALRTPEGTRHTHEGAGIAGGSLGLSGPESSDSVVKSCS